MADKPRIIIDTNKHGIRREINLDSLWKKTQKRKAYEANRANKYKKKNTKANVSHETNKKSI